MPAARHRVPDLVCGAHVEAARVIDLIHRRERAVERDRVLEVGLGVWLGRELMRWKSLGVVGSQQERSVCMDESKYEYKWEGVVLEAQESQAGFSIPINYLA